MSEGGAATALLCSSYVLVAVPAGVDSLVHRPLPSERSVALLN